MSCKKTILIIDKDPGSISSLYNFFNDNYKIVCKETGFEALNWCMNGNKADIILVTIDLINHNYSELTECISKKTGNKKIPVIALLCKQQLENKIRKLNSNVVGIYKKPFNPEDLSSKITSLLQESKKGISTAN